MNKLKNGQKQMTNEDIRWLQRFENFTKALNQLTRFVKKNQLNEFEIQGLIQCFEYNYELAWNVIKDFYENQGEAGIQGSRDAIRLAFGRGLIDDGDVWMKMVKSRALTSHTYNEDIAMEISDAIYKEYYPAFLEIQKKFKALKKKEQY